MYVYIQYVYAYCTLKASIFAFKDQNGKNIQSYVQELRDQALILPLYSMQNMNAEMAFAKHEYKNTDLALSGRSILIVESGSSSSRGCARFSKVRERKRVRKL